MHKMTLLEMTQNILSAMSSDEVNSITDTIESQQVADEIQNTFYELYSNRELAKFEGLVNLEPSGDDTLPHVLKIPDDVEEIYWVKYLDVRNHMMVELTYLDPETFVRRVIEEPLNAMTPYAEVKLLPTSDVLYTIPMNKCPSYYTLLANNNMLICDSWDAENEANLTAAHSFAWGRKNQVFNLDNDFIAPIDAGLFPHFLAEAKSACFVTIKEVANSKEEQRARRQLVRSQTHINRSQDQRRSSFDGHDYSRKR